MTTPHEQLSHALWRIYQRPPTPMPGTLGGNLPWDDPAFAARMLREHLDESHGAASRVAAEREAQLAWLWARLALSPGEKLLDVTCGPGLYAVPLAAAGLRVTGVDFAPAAIEYARALAAEQGVADSCHFVEADVREVAWPDANFDAALVLYGQLAVFPRAVAQTLLERIARALKPGGRLLLELLDPARIDRTDGRWWFTDDKGLWGDAPFLHLGERHWNEAERVAHERYHILHLDSGHLAEIQLDDYAYTASEMQALLRSTGFTVVDVYPAWDGLPLYDADEWLVYIARRRRA